MNRKAEIERAERAMHRAMGVALVRDDCELKAAYSAAATAAITPLLDREEALRSALERVSRNFDLLLAGKPVRDVAETKAEVRAALQTDTAE